MSLKKALPSRSGAGLFDTHTHLGDPQFSADRDAVLARAQSAGVGQIVEIADAPGEWAQAIALCRARPFIRCSLGLHPYYAADFSPALLNDLEEKVRLPEVVAIGEIGLDYVKSEIPRDVQRHAFEALLAAAKSWNVPVVIHCRGAFEDLLPILKNIFPSPPTGSRFWGVIHCFSGNSEEALFCAKAGFALGADGPITYPKNEPLRSAFRAAGVQAAVLETDCPYLPPQSSRGKRNEPALLVEVAAKLAEVYALPFEELARVTTENGRALFRLPK